MTEWKRNDPVRIRGYKPATVCTGRLNSKGEILVQFEGEGRLWMRADRLSPG